jgi:iron complex transport system ATP-binding protein
MLLADGAMKAAGPIAEVLTGENLSDTFGLELVVSTSEHGRYAARAAS